MGEDEIEVLFDAERNQYHVNGQPLMAETLNQINEQIQPGPIISMPKQNGKASLLQSVQQARQQVRAQTDLGWVDRRSETIGLDFETFGTRDLPKVGLDNYLADPEFQVLIARMAWQSLVRADEYRTHGYDFVADPVKARKRLAGDISQAHTIVAYNVDFERKVLARIGIDTSHIQWIDAAMIARAMGSGGKLEAAAPQLLNVPKMAAGTRLINKFSKPNKAYNFRAPTWEDVKDDEDWALFDDYCGIDARLALQMGQKYGARVLPHEYRYERITSAMNDIGWTVDRKAVSQMQARYEVNKAEALRAFRLSHDPGGTLNLNSHKQLQQWCLARGVRAKSFDEEHVEALLGKVIDKLASLSITDPKYHPLSQVRALLYTKQILGGSSLTKLEVIARTTADDGQLRGQYMHLGAGQSYRTSGRGVQMQNLKRLHNIRDLGTLVEPTESWSNTELAENLRQLFTASVPMGSLVVGDFSSVESRGLAFLAGESWKLHAYRDGKDLYKIQAAGMYSVSYEQVTKDQRQTGKVGELSCGYGAGPGAVQRFASKMGVAFTTAQASKLVNDWREINPAIVEMWERLGVAFTDVVKHPSVTPGEGQRAVALANGMSVEFVITETPQSLVNQHPGAKSICMTLMHKGSVLLQRLFHGCYMRGRDVCYYKPSDRVGGPLWKANFRDPKTKEIVFHKLYGGKIAGILTQSFCREIFFIVLHNVAAWAQRTPGVQLIGQFHDEIVLDYNPTEWGAPPLRAVQDALTALMSDPGLLVGFPLGAEVQHDYRYIK